MRAQGYLQQDPAYEPVSHHYKRDKMVLSCCCVISSQKLHKQFDKYRPKFSQFALFD